MLNCLWFILYVKCCTTLKTDSSVKKKKYSNDRMLIYFSMKCVWFTYHSLFSICQLCSLQMISGSLLMFSWQASATVMSIRQANASFSNTPAVHCLAVVSSRRTVHLYSLPWDTSYNWACYLKNEAAQRRLVLFIYF